MTSVFDTLVDAHKADSFPISIAYSKDSMQKEEIAKKVGTRGIMRFLCPAPLDPEATVRKSTLGTVEEVKAFMVVFAPTARECVEGLQNWFLRVGYASQTGIVGNPYHAPWTYSTLSLLSYSPIGSIEQFAEPYGEVYALEQYVRISIV